MKKIIKPSLLVIALGSLIAACAVQVPKNNIISISPLDSGHIKVEYQLISDSIDLSDFYGSITPQLRKNWKPLNECGQLIDGKSLSKIKGCKRITFSVPIEASFTDRVNPPAYPMDEQGVLIHTGTFAIKSNNVIWAFESPNGELIIGGTNRGKTAKFIEPKDEFIHYTSVFFSYKKLTNDISVIATKATPTTLTTRITESSKQVSHYYQTTYRTQHFSAPMLFINNVNQVSSTGLQADVSPPGMIRFGFFNWQDNQQELDQARGIAAHEFAHTLQPSNLHLQNYGSLVHEGGAEFIRWMAEYHLGWRTKEQLASNFSNSLYACLAASNNQHWKAIKDYQGQTPYDCGLIAHVIALASRKTSESAEQTLGNFYSTIAQNPTFSFAQALECGSEKDCKANFLPALLESDRKLIDVVDAQLTQLGLINNKNYGENAFGFIQVSKKAFEALSMEDCGGFDYYSNPDNFTTGNMLKCKAIGAGNKISGVNGISYFSDPLKALEAQNKGCTKEHKVTLGTLDNKQIVVNCSQSITPQKNYYEIDIDKLLTLLDKH